MRRRKPPTKTNAAAVVALRSPSDSLRQYRDKGISIPRTMTPKKSRRPHAFSQARKTGPSDIMTRDQNEKLQARHPCVDAVQRRKTRHGPSGSMRQQNHQRRRSRCGRYNEEHSEQRSVGPDGTIGHSEQDSRIAGNIEAENSADDRDNSAPMLSRRPHGAEQPASVSDRRRVSALRNDRKANKPNIRSAQEPIDIGDQYLNIGRYVFDSISMCQKRSGLLEIHGQQQPAQNHAWERDVVTQPCEWTVFRLCQRDRSATARK